MSTLETWVGLDGWREAAARQPANWLVTGGGGFIGSHLVEELLRAGQRVAVLDNFATGHRRNLDAACAAAGGDASERLTLLEGDIRNPDDCNRAAEGVAVILHQAALGSVPRSIADPVTTHEVNVDGFLCVLEAARAQGVQRLVYASSSSVYGDAEALPKVEDVVGKPLSPYASTKRMNEVLAQGYASCFGLQLAGLRYFNVFGPRQDPAGPYAAVIPKWLAALAAGETCTIHGDGETTRDFCYIDNVVQANLLAATRPLTGARVYNVAAGGRTSLNELFAALREAVVPHQQTAADAQAIYADFRPGDVRHSQASIDRVAEELGFSPSHQLADGLAATVQAELHAS